jgi:hypothetical protein
LSSGCGSLVSRCGISAADFTKYNPKTDLCSTLQVGDYVCCSAGDPHIEPKPVPPKQGGDGICATHLIKNGDSCDALAKQYGVTVADLEKWNKGKTWAWTECKNMVGNKKPKFAVLECLIILLSFSRNFLDQAVTDFPVSF